MRRMGGGRRGARDEIEPRGAGRRRGAAVDDFGDDPIAGPLDVRIREPERGGRSGALRDDGLFDEIDDALDASDRDLDRDGDLLDAPDGEGDGDGLFSGRLRDGPPARERNADLRPLRRDPVDPPAPVLGPDRTGRFAWLATVVWVGGVSAFVLGFAGVPLGDPAIALQAVGEMHPRLVIMWLAAAIAPLGLIWMSAVVARRARDLKLEAARLAAIGGASAARPAGVDMAEAEAQLDAARDGVAAIEQAVEGAEARARALLDALEAERETLAAAVADLDGDARSLVAAIDQARSGAADGADAIADRIAAAVAARVGDVGAAQPARPAQAPAPAETPGRSSGGAVARATDAAMASLGDGVFSGRAEDETDGPDGEAADDGSGRLNALRRRIGRRAARTRDPEPRAAAPATPAAAPEPEPPRRAAPQPEPDRAPPVDRRAAAASPKPARRRSGGGLNWEKLIRAANFPDSEDDRETLDALYAVLTDPEAAALLQAAEDTLSALADIGLFMEDLKPQHAPADRWRAFILDGDDGAARELGGVRDEAALEDVSHALDDRPTFRDASSRFVDRYERMLERIFDEASDPAIAVELADTRSGRAYMLLGRASGRFA